MEEISTSQPQENEFNASLCANCQVNIFEPGHPINLCSSCRTTLINYPIPKWIKIFAIAIAAVIVVSIVRTQLYISAAINLGKSEKAIENGAYVTAQNELKKVLLKFPDNITANANMVIASSYNFDFVALNSAYQKIVDKKIDDEDLLNEVNAAMNFIEGYFVQETIMGKKIDSAAQNSIQLVQLYQDLKAKSGENILKMKIANLLYDLKDYNNAEVISTDVLKIDKDFYSGLSLMSALKRDAGRYDEALACCDRMLKLNTEDIYALGQKTRVELKRKHDHQAEIYAKEAMRINPTADSSLEAMAMVDYFAGRKKESLASLKLINSHISIGGDSTISKRLTPIINGSKIYR